MPKLTRDQVKRGAKIVVGISTGFTVGHVIAHNMSPKNALQKSELFIGAAVIGGMVADQAEDWTSRQIDMIADAWIDIKESITVE